MSALRCTAALTAAILALTACSSSSGTTTPAGTAADFSARPTGTLKSSGFNPSDEVGKSRQEYAGQQLPGVTVTLDTTGFDPQKFSAQAASGNVPDLIQLNRDVVDTLADKGLVLPLDECYKAHDVVPDQRYYPAAIKDVTHDGKVYGIPQFFQTSLIVGNKAVMDAAGVSAADLDTSKPDRVLAAAKKMARVANGKPTLLGFDGDVPGSSALWLHVFGGATNDAHGKPTLDDAKNVAALTWLKQLMDAQGGYASVKSFKDTMDVFGDENQYVKGQVGAQTWAQWYVNVLAPVRNQVQLVGVPVRGADGKAIGVAFGTAFAIPKAGKNPGAACAWALAATSPEAWQTAAAARNATVVQKKGVNTGLFTGSPAADTAIRAKYVRPSGNAGLDQVVATSYQGLANPVSFGGSAVGQQINDALNNAVIVAMGGEKTPTQALQEAQATALRAWGQSNAGKQG